MSDFEKLYTVEDISMMTMLTSRTIRNYLKDGLLTGRKIGGQWRFTRQDIEKLFERNEVEADIKNTRRQDLMDFIDGTYTDMSGDMQVCTIVDYYCEDTGEAKKLSDRLCELINGIHERELHRFHYEYMKQEAKARYTLFGPPSFVAEALRQVEEVWKALHTNLDAFSRKADNYQAYRPSYPDALLSYIHSKTSGTGAVFADIGAGTGKMSECLLKIGAAVYGVEPNEAMREEAVKKLSGNPAYVSVNGTAEATSLDADFVDAIVCAEAYHWFDNENSRLEFKRILKQGGYVFLVWNLFSEKNPYGQETAALNEKLCPNYRKKDFRVPKDERASHLFGDYPYEKIVLNNTIRQSREALLGGKLSASYAPHETDENYPAFVEGVNAIFDRYSRDGYIETIFETVCYCGKLE